MSAKKKQAAPEKQPRTGQVLLSEIERMALEQLEAVRGEIDRARARHREAARRFIAAFAKAHATPSAIKITTNPEGTVASWEEVSNAEKEADRA